MDALEATIDLPMNEAEARVRAALADQGFGVLTEIDVAATLKAKLGVDRPPLKILGACNPDLAHEALQRDPTVALALPCNVVIEPIDDDHTRIRAIDPTTLLPGDTLTGLAASAAAKLTTALESAAHVAARLGQ